MAASIGALRIAGGIALAVLALGASVLGWTGGAPMGAVCGLVCTILSGIVLAADGDREAFTAFWGIGPDAFLLFVAAPVAGWILEALDLPLAAVLGELLGTASLCLFGLAVAGVLRTEAGQAAFFALARISVASILPLLIVILLLLTFLSGL